MYFSSFLKNYSFLQEILKGEYSLSIASLPPSLSPFLPPSSPPPPSLLPPFLPPSLSISLPPSFLPPSLPPSFPSSLPPYSLAKGSVDNLLEVSLLYLRPLTITHIIISNKRIIFNLNIIYMYVK